MKTASYYPVYEMADIFPPLQGEKFDDLVHDIKVNGLRTPIRTYHGKIIEPDTVRACILAGIEPYLKECDVNNGTDGRFIASFLRWERKKIDEAAAKLFEAPESKRQSDSASTIEEESPERKSGNCRTKRNQKLKAKRSRKCGTSEDHRYNAESDDPVRQKSLAESIEMLSSSFGGRVDLICQLFESSEGADIQPLPREVVLEKLDRLKATNVDSAIKRVPTPSHVN